MEPRFSVGQNVRMRATPERAGLVTEVSAYGGGFTYKVFFSMDDQALVNESGLELVPDGGARTYVVSREAFLRGLLVTRLRSPLSDVLYAFQASRTKFEAYQFKPVLKFLDAPLQSILIADEVGLGKTIEAAILLQELRARGTMNRVLVICPAGLREKWQAELLNRFDEQFQIMFKKEVKQDAYLYAETQGHAPLNGIVSLETFRAQDVQDTIEEAGVTYDLVIIDEAHHLRNTGTLSNAVGERIQEVSPHVLLLTATPLQTSQEDLFNLLTFLDPGQFERLDDFMLQLEPNSLLNEAISRLRHQPPDLGGAKAALLRIDGLEAGAQVTHHPLFPSIIRRLEQGNLDRESLVRLRRDIDSLNVISSIYTRTVKRDVSGAAKRRAFAVNVAVTEEEAVFLDAVLSHARAQARSKSATGWTPGFAGIMRERQAASCITAMREYLEKSQAARATGSPTPSLRVEASNPDLDDEPGTTNGFDVAASEAHLADAAAALGKIDSKFDAFLDTLKGVLAENDHSKVIVFTYFRNTIAYLEKQLRQHGIQPTVIHGGVKPEDRARRIAGFRDHDQARVLLTTEVGSEGLDFQFCDTMFNYDLPWNPMRVEQRIGRIDRYGQRSASIRIYSFFLRGTIEERILERLYTRIGIFEESIGELEPIIGPMVSDLTRDVFRSDLTPEEEAQVAEQYAQMIIQRREHERELEKSSSQLLGQDALLMQAIDDSIQSGRVVSPAELRSLVNGYLSEVMDVTLIDRAQDGMTALVPSNAKLRAAVAASMAENRDTRPGSAEFLHKLDKGTRVAATFAGETAYEMQTLEFLNLRHPLVRLASEHFLNKVDDDRPTPLTCLTVDTSQLTQDTGPWPGSGDYEFVLVLLSVTGAQDQVRLLPIVLDRATGQRVQEAEDRLLRIVQDHAVDDERTVTSDERAGIESRAMQIAAAEADQMEAEAIERNEASIVVRRATLERSFGHRIAKRKSLLAQATNENIIRMRRAEIANLEADLQRRVAALEAKRHVAVTFEPVGAGYLSITDAPVLTAAPDEAEGVPAPALDEVPPFEEPEQVFTG